MRWIKIKSWHAIEEMAEVISRDGTKFTKYLTYCGRYAPGHGAEELPAAKSCELCLRLIARMDDALDAR